MTDDAQLPKQELLIKLLRMTTSDNDGEALTALRKANALLRSAGWDWEKLINAKIRVVANPFSGGLREPPRSTPVNGSGSPPPPPQWTKSAPPPPPPPPPVSKTTWPIGINPNRFPAPCYCCGIEVVANAGVIFRPNKYHSRAPSDWKVACTTCNTTATISSYPAAPIRRKGKRNVSDLA